jgi:tRNA dimethylallyltransferase
MHSKYFGKKVITIELAKRINGEIISADSRLFYKGMDIGTAKPTLEQREKIPHYLIDVAEPDEVWSLSVFQKEIERSIEEIQNKQKIAIIVGGTGQYIRSIVEGWEIPTQMPDEKLRLILEGWGREIGPFALHKKLSIIDKPAAEKIEPQNVRRTIRALEVIFSTGSKFSEQRTRSEPKHDFWIIGLNRPRPELYSRVDERIEMMFKNGFLEETKRLLDQGISRENPNMSAIGYREACQVLNNEITLEEAKAIMRKKTREFVRRQANWFKPDDSNIHWYNMDGNELEKIIQDLRIEKLLE